MIHVWLSLSNGGSFRENWIECSPLRMRPFAARTWLVHLFDFVVGLVIHTFTSFAFLCAISPHPDNILSRRRVDDAWRRLVSTGESTVSNTITINCAANGELDCYVFVLSLHSAHTRVEMWPIRFGSAKRHSWQKWNSEMYCHRLTCDDTIKRIVHRSLSISPNGRVRDDIACATLRRN